MRPTLALAAWFLLVPPRQWIEIRNVDMHLNDSLTLRIRSLHGEVLRTAADRHAALDDVRSFRIRITAGTVALTGDDVAALLNTVIFAYPGAPMSDISVRFDSAHIVTTGILHKLGPHKVELTGTVSLTADGRIQLHVVRTHVLGLNGEKLLHTLGLHLDNAVDLSHAHGATIKGDDIFLDPLPVLPPPAIEGRLAAVRIDGDQLVEEFAPTADDAAFRRAVTADTTANFVYFRGGELSFGRLLMDNTNLRITGGDAHTPFDLSLPRYNRQLVAGYSRTRADSGLTVYMPNYSSLPAPHR